MYTVFASRSLTSNLHFLDCLKSIFRGLDFDVLKFTWQKQLIDDFKLTATIENRFQRHDDVRFAGDTGWLRAAIQISAS